MVARWQVSGAHQIGKLFMHNPYPKMCRIDRRAAYPSTAQLLLDGLNWQLELLLT